MAKQNKGTSYQRDRAGLLHRFASDGQFGPRRVEDNFPGSGGHLVRQPKTNRLVVSIEQKKKIVVVDVLAGVVPDLRRIAAEKHAQRAHPAVFPVGRLHGFSIRTKPPHIFLMRRRIRISLVKTVTMEIGMAPPVTGDRGREIEKVPLPLIEVPMAPGEFAVLAVAVV